LFRTTKSKGFLLQGDNVKAHNVTWDIFNPRDITDSGHDILASCTGHILADAGKREVKLLEDWNLKSFA
jgi:hypothetical protein